MSLFRRTLVALLVAVLPALPGCARAQIVSDADATRGPVLASSDSSRGTTTPGAASATFVPYGPAPVPMFPTVLAPFKSRADSVAWSRARHAADRSEGFRVVVSLRERRLLVIMDADTLREAPVAVASGETLEYAGRRWRFDTPRGVRRVLGKDSMPVWIPPEWAYAEVAKEHGLALAHLPPNRPVRLRDGGSLVVRDSLAGVLGEDGQFYELPVDEHIVFDGKLFVPPLGTRNRRIPGILGKFRLDMGNGYLLHGTPDPSSIGRATTHGCIRLHDEDIEWLYQNVPVGTKVYIY